MCQTERQIVCVFERETDRQIERNSECVTEKDRKANRKTQCVCV